MGTDVSMRGVPGPAMPFVRKLLAFVVATMPLTAHVACSATNGDAIPPEVRDAGSLEASNTSPGGGDDDDEDAGQRDASDAAKDARVDAEPVTSTELHINEIYVDIDGLGDGAEFVELRGEPNTPVHDLKLRILDEAGVVKYTVIVGDAGEKVRGSGYWVVGGNQTFKLGVLDHIDQIIPLNGWGLPTSRGAVQLVRGTAIVDVVSWSTDPDAAGIPAPSSLPAQTGEGSPARVPTIKKTSGMPAHSFGRASAAPDTNDNRADFCSMVASPGREQMPCD